MSKEKEHHLSPFCELENVMGEGGTSQEAKYVNDKKTLKEDLRENHPFW